MEWVFMRFIIMFTSTMELSIIMVMNPINNVTNAKYFLFQRSTEKNDVKKSPYQLKLPFILEIRNKYVTSPS
jgi:hypothetical protein